MRFKYQNIDYDFADFSVLLVDDSQTSLKTVSLMLGHTGIKLYSANSGAEALEKVNRHSPDIILLDINMPLMNGFEVCQKLKSDAMTAHIPVIFITALSDVNTIVRGFEIGGIDYIVKPFNSKELVARLSTHLAVMTMHHKLTKAYEQMSNDLNIAARHQQNYIPIGNFNIGNFAFSSIYYPSSFLSGDMFNFIKINDSHISFYIADVSGHGIPAAFLSLSIARRLSTERRKNNPIYDCDDINEKCPKVNTPSNVIKLLNRNYYREKSVVDYFTLIYGLINTETGELTISTAGHPAPLLQKGSEITAFDMSGHPIGLFENIEVEDYTMNISIGNRLFLYSDGLIEALDKINLSFIDIIDEYSDKSIESISKTIENILKACGVPNDDISLIIIERLL